MALVKEFEQLAKQEEIEVKMVFPIPGKWTIETRKGGEFILTNGTNQSATAYIKIEEGKWQLEKR